MTHPRVAVLVAVLAAASLGGWRLGQARRSEAVPAMVTAVVDGDTVEVSLTGPDGAGRQETVRLLGVDTPETVHPDRPVECFGPEASAFTAAGLLGRPVSLRFDRVARDRYGRLLAFVDLDGRSFNEALLTGGYARLLVIPPNGRGARHLLDLELAACC